MTAKDDNSRRSGTEQKPDARKPAPAEKEVGGRKGPEPTRYGDWEKNGIVSDF